jgi:hypothetical protein
MNAKKVTLYIIYATVPGMALLIFLFINRPEPYEAELRAGAIQRGVDPEEVVKLATLEVKLKNEELTEREWSELEALTKNPEPHIRENAYAVLSINRKTKNRERALQLIRNSKNDEEPRISNKYCWNLMTLESPGWREQCSNDLASGNDSQKQWAQMAFTKAKESGRE